MSSTKRSVVRPMSRHVENYEHVLMCLICRSIFDDHDHQPKFLPCHHTFCKECLREYVRQMGDDIECPSCRKVTTVPAAGVAALQTNFYANYIRTLIYGGGAGGFGGLGAGPGGGQVAEPARACEKHEGNCVEYYCRDCVASACRKCVSEGECATHKCVALAAATEQFHQSIDSSFSDANTVIEKKKIELESLLKTLSEEKDQALLKIESTFESHVHVMSRRATLLKNNVIDVYNEHVAGLEADLEEISTAMTCIVSLKEYHEALIGKSDFTDTDKGIREIDEVRANIEERINPSENHIVFVEKHGVDKFRACAADLGRVICNKTGSQRPVSAISVSSSQPTSPDETSYNQSAACRPASAVLPQPSSYKPCNNSVDTAPAGILGAAGDQPSYLRGGAPEHPKALNDISELDGSGSLDVAVASGASGDSNSFTVRMRKMAADGQYTRGAGRYNCGDGDGKQRDEGVNRHSMGMSYDESRLRRELGVGGGRGEGTGKGDPRRLSRSEFWATLSETKGAVHVDGDGSNS